MKLAHITSKTRRRLNRFLVVIAILIVVLSSFGIQTVVQQIANDERSNAKMWASSVQQKAQLITQSRDYFEHIERMERERIERWAEAVTRLFFYRTPAEYEFYRRTIAENTTIPCFVVVGHNRRVLDCRNTDLDCSKIRFLNDTLLEEYSQYPPICIRFERQYWCVYYKQSKAFYQLQYMLDGLINSFITEIVENSIFVPVLLVTEDELTVVEAGNISATRYANADVLKETLESMRHQNKPIEISDGVDTYYVFYENSRIMGTLTYIPIIFFLVITAFIAAIVLIFSMSRRSESNKLWVGMSRETAHQLGTPLSSLIGWVEFLKTEKGNEEFTVEIEKDINRLKMISERFSKIGSAPKMTEENMVDLVYESISYLQSRLSHRIKFNVNKPLGTVVPAKVNPLLIEWVMENLFKNAVDVIGSNDGLIQIDVTERNKNVVIDITDNGRGLPKDMWNVIFDAGYTTKMRGWGLGLTLSRRIIHDYHKGEIFVRRSAMGEGTTFRIILNK